MRAAFSEGRFTQTACCIFMAVERMRGYMTKAKDSLCIICTRLGYTEIGESILYTFQVF